MRTSIEKPRLAAAPLLIAMTVLAGCGQNNTDTKNTAVQQQPVAKRGIFLSSAECGDLEELSVTQCGEAIQQALAADDKETTGYDSQEQCHAKFAHSRCEQRMGGRYYRRPQAFLVTFSSPPTAVALFRPAHAVIGFRSASGQDIDANEKGLQLSKAAYEVAKENAASPDGGGSDEGSSDGSDSIARAVEGIR